MDKGYHSRVGRVRGSQPRQAAWAYLLLTVSNLRRVAWISKLPVNIKCLWWPVAITNIALLKI